MKLQGHWAVAIEINENASIHSFNISSLASFQLPFLSSFSAVSQYERFKDKCFLHYFAAET